MNRFLEMDADQLDDALDEFIKRGEELIADVRLVSEALVRDAKLEPVQIWTDILVAQLISGFTEEVQPESTRILHYAAEQRRENS